MRHILALGLVTALASPGPLVLTAAAAPPRTSVSSPLVGIVEGQRAHLTLTHPVNNKKAETCDAVLAFVDDQGRTLKQQAVRIGPGQGTFLALDWSEGATANQRGRLHYRAVVTFGSDACNAAIAGHEMVNNADEKTTVFIGVYQE